MMCDLLSVVLEREAKAPRLHQKTLDDIYIRVRQFWNDRKAEQSLETAGDLKKRWQASILFHFFFVVVVVYLFRATCPVTVVPNVNRKSFQKIMYYSSLNDFRADTLSISHYFAFFFWCVCVSSSSSSSFPRTHSITQEEQYQ